MNAGQQVTSPGTRVLVVNFAASLADPHHGICLEIGRLNSPSGSELGRRRMKVSEPLLPDWQMPSQK
jgi:hypothetical protein